MTTKELNELESYISNLAAGDCYYPSELFEEIRALWKERDRLQTKADAEGAEVVRLKREHAEMGYALDKARVVIEKVEAYFNNIDDSACTLEEITVIDECWQVVGKWPKEAPE